MGTDIPTKTDAAPLEMAAAKSPTAKMARARRVARKAPRHINRIRLFRLAGAGLGLCLIALAVPRTEYAWRLAEARPLLAGMEAGATPNPQERRALSRILDTASRYDTDGRARAVRATVALADESGTPFDQAQRLTRAETDLTAALAQRPTDATWWARLAHTRYRLAFNQMNGPAADALRRSYATGPYALPPQAFRLQISLESWPDLPEDLRKAAIDQTGAMAANWSLAGDLAGLYLRATPEAQDRIRSLIDRSGQSQDYMNWQLTGRSGEAVSASSALEATAPRRSR